MNCFDRVVSYILSGTPLARIHFWLNYGDLVFRENNFFSFLEPP